MTSLRRNFATAVTWLVAAVVVTACGSETVAQVPKTEHAPVDPALDLAILAPHSMQRVEANAAKIRRSKVFETPEAWASFERERNRSFTVGEPKADGDGWVLPMTSYQADMLGEWRLWYRKLGDDLAITCVTITAMGEPSAAQVEMTRKVCFSTQRVPDGVYVPFQLSRTERVTRLELALVDEPLSWSVEIERAADAPPGRFEPKGMNGDQRRIDHSRVSDGSWFLSTGKSAVSGARFEHVTHRFLGQLELACYASTIREEQYARRQLALCLSLEQP
jgi:hypothetical protein